MNLPTLSESAWLAFSSSRPRSGTAVGVAILTDNHDIYVGTNIELEFRLGLHAEIGAIAQMMVADPGANIAQVLIAAERELFMPCGSCLDWILQVGGPDCIVIHEDEPGHQTLAQPAGHLMPWYPR